MTDTKIKTCKEHGDYESKLIPMFGMIDDRWTRCQICEQLKKDAEEKEKHELELKEAEMKWQNGLNTARIPKRFRNVSFDNFQAQSKSQQDAFKICNDYVKDIDNVLETGKSIVFVGLTGTGKTHLAISTGFEFMRQNKTCLYSTVKAALNLLRSSWNTSEGISEIEAIKRLVEPDLLILDEVGVQSGTEAERNSIYEFMNGRYEEMKPTIVISNCDKSEIESFLGERIIDRLRQGGGEVITFNWESYRK